MTRLDDIIDLPENWDSYGNSAPYTVVADSARLIAFLMRQLRFREPTASPSSSGGIILDWSDGVRELTIDLDGVDGITFSYDVDGKNVDEGDIHRLCKCLFRFVTSVSI